MNIQGWSATPDLNDIYQDIRTLGLESNLAELEAYGFTVVEDALTQDETDYFRNRILEITEERIGKPLDLENETDYKDLGFIPYLLYKDPAFKKSVINPKTLTLITYLLGKRRILSSLGCHLKGPGGQGLLLHSDTGNGVPDPFPPYSQVANCNYALTDYTEENGALAMVPGSHRMARQPTAGEKGLTGNERNPHVIPIEVRAGSAIVWHGNTWHGSFPRAKPGLRVNLSNFYCREYIQPQEDYRNTVPADFLDDADSELASLLGADLVHGWTEEGPLKLFERRSKAAAEIRSWYN